MDLQDCRHKIDRIDDELVRLFAERMQISARIAVYKKKNALPILDEKREREKLAEIAGKLPDGLKEYGTALYERIFQLSRGFQERVICADAQKKCVRSNIVLIGMPGCGKTTLARRLASVLGREAFDSDDLIREKAGMSIPEVFSQWGEGCFRELETAALTALALRENCVIATGGGCVTREENYAILHESGVVIWIRRDLDKLPTAGRPISQQRDLRELYAERAPLYERFADAIVENDGSMDDAVEKVIAILKKEDA